MESHYFPDEFVYGWPRKLCGCDQIIESCSYCCGSYAGCSSCMYCYGRAYIELPCPHSRVPLHAVPAPVTDHSIPLPPWAQPRSRSPPAPPVLSPARYPHKQRQVSLPDVAFASSLGERSPGAGKAPGDGGAGRDADESSPSSPSSTASSSASRGHAAVSPSKRRPRCPRSKKGSGSDGSEECGSKGGNGRSGSPGE